MCVEIFVNNMIPYNFICMWIECLQRDNMNQLYILQYIQAWWGGVEACLQSIMNNASRVFSVEAIVHVIQSPRL